MRFGSARKPAAIVLYFLAVLGGVLCALALLTVIRSIGALAGPTELEAVARRQTRVGARDRSHRTAAGLEVSPQPGRRALDRGGSGSPENRYQHRRPGDLLHLDG